MNQIWQIVDWNERFENYRSRERQELHFVCIPNKLDGDGFLRLMKLKQGPAFYGIFHMMVCKCSQQRIPRNGFLTIDGSPSGEFWDLDDLAYRWRRSADEIREALGALSDPKIGWIRSPGAPAPAAHPQRTARAPDAHPPATDERKEGRKEGGTPPSEIETETEISNTPKYSLKLNSNGFFSKPDSDSVSIGAQDIALVRLLERFQVPEAAANDRTPRAKQARSDRSTLKAIVQHVVSGPTKRDATEQGKKLVALADWTVKNAGQVKPIAKFVNEAKRANPGLFEKK